MGGGGQEPGLVGRPRAERCLRLLLRVLGSASLLAFAAVFLPYGWMNAIHRGLGMGVMPASPIVGYLARSLSLFYALLGGLLWVCASDPGRHRRVVSYLGAAFIVFGLVTWGVDFLEGMPSVWRHWEGPFVMMLGAVFLLLARRSGRDLA